MGLPPWEASSSQFFALITGANSGLGFAISQRLIEDFLAAPTTPPTRHLVLLICTRSATKSADAIDRLRAQLNAYARRLHAHPRRRGQQQQQQHDDDDEDDDNNQDGRRNDWRHTVARVHFLGLTTDLCDLRSVYALGRRLREGTVRCGGGGLGGGQEVRVPRLDAVVLNAGVGGWTGIDWWRVVPRLLTDFWEETTWPTFRIAARGLRARAQLSASRGGHDAHGGEAHEREKRASSDTKEDWDRDADEEPPLGQIFCANVFGHYILCHELMPLLSTSATSEARGGGRILWISSVDVCRGEEFDIDDMQGLESSDAYGQSKRLVDHLALTSTLPSTRRYVEQYTRCDAVGSPDQSTTPAATAPSLVPPTMYTVHPGIFNSEILPIHRIMAFLWWLLSYFIRDVLGNPWHVISARAAATAPTWVALADDRVLADLGGAAIKWGSSVDRLGGERVRMTETEGWGWNGEVAGVADDVGGAGAAAGAAAADLGDIKGSTAGHRRAGRRRGARDLTTEDREHFIETGVKAWRQMEELRMQWEERLGVRER